MPNAQETVVKNKVLVQKCDALMAPGSFRYKQNHGMSENPDLMMKSSPTLAPPHPFPNHSLSVKLNLPRDYLHHGGVSFRLVPSTI